MAVAKSTVMAEMSPYKGFMADIDQYVIYRGEIFNIKDLLQEKFLVKEALADLTFELQQLKDIGSNLSDENLHLTLTIEKLTAKAEISEKAINEAYKEITEGQAEIERLKDIIGDGKRGLDALFDKPADRQLVKEINDLTEAKLIDPPEAAPAPESVRCNRCKNDKVSRYGFRDHKTLGRIQQYKCNNCGKVFAPGTKQQKKRRGRKH